MKITDTHCHLDEDRFETDRDEVMRRAGAAGVSRLISVGTDIQSDIKTIALVEKYTEIYAVIGIHPHESGTVKEADFSQLEKLAIHTKVVGIGETGLDFFRNHAGREAQIANFQRHLEIAAKLKLPVIIHTRQATADTLAILQQWVTVAAPGVIHCFSGDWQAAKQFLSLGFYLSFAGYIGYPRSHSPEVIKQTPPDKLLVETDAPFLPPQPHRGQRNEPAYIAETVKVMAAALDKTPEATAEMTTANALRLFKFQ